MSSKPTRITPDRLPSSDRVAIEGAETLSDNWGRLTKYSIAIRLWSLVKSHEATL